MSILSDADLRFWHENGYVVVHDVVPPENLTAAADEIWGFLGMNPQDPNDWYHSPHSPDGMVGVYQTQGLWNNRQAPRVYGAFPEILGRPDLLGKHGSVAQSRSIRAPAKGYFRCIRSILFMSRSSRSETGLDR